MMSIHNNFSKYNLPNQSHKNTTILTSNLGSFPTTRFHINQPYHFQARRGMKKTIVGETCFIKTFVNAFVHMRFMGANSNQVELVSRDQMDNFLSKKTGLFVRLNKPKGWDKMTSNQHKGFFGEEIQKEINLTKASTYGHYIEQTPSGTHPSSNKGPDVVKHELIFGGVSSDQSSVEFKLQTTVQEMKTTSGTMSETSLNRSVLKNKHIKQTREQKGKHYEDVEKQHAEQVSNSILNDSLNVVEKSVIVEAVGFAGNLKKANEVSELSTDLQTLYKVSAETLDDLAQVFDVPEKSAFAQIEYSNDG